HYIRIIKDGVSSPTNISDGAGGTTVKNDVLSPGAASFVELLCATGDAPDPEHVALAYLTYYERNGAYDAILQKALSGLKRPFERGKALFYAGRLSEAESAMREAVRQAPRDAERRFYLGEILEAQAKFAAAEREYAEAFALNEHLFQAAAKQAHALIKSRPGDDDALRRARELFARAAQINPGDASVWAGLAFAEMNLGRLADAQKAVEKALALDPDLPVALENAAYLCLLKGNRAQARAHLTHLSRKHPRHPALARLRAAVR
ncbi:MAG: tetratricopeptide repeat protein, partial [Bacteroidia bacterium]|nr:tetratricopeptide repeat protein [Bacteroidia bacterium]